MDVWKKTLEDWAKFSKLVAHGGADPVFTEGAIRYQERVFGEVRHDFIESRALIGVGRPRSRSPQKQPKPVNLERKIRDGEILSMRAAGYKFREIAEAMGLSIGTISKIYYREGGL